jgi:hypothetical protein
MHESLYFIIYIVLLFLLLNNIFPNNLIVNNILSILIMMIIFINVNPYNYNENKFTILKHIPPQYIPKTELLNDINVNNVKFPIIIKSIYCTIRSRGVVIIKNKNELNNYLSENSNNLSELIYQDFIPYTNEVGILYEKDLFTKKGRIVSITKKISQNFEIMPGCTGGVNCKNLTNYITPKLNNIIDKISNHIPNFNVGRYDIKYKDEESLFNGENFYILEANGTMGLDLRKYTSSFLMSQYYMNRWFFYRLFYGIKNILTRNGYNLYDNVIVIRNAFKKRFICNDWEALLKHY